MIDIEELQRLLKEHRSQSELCGQFSAQRDHDLARTASNKAMDAESQILELFDRLIRAFDNYRD
jgi:hypothetical protein